MVIVSAIAVLSAVLYAGLLVYYRFAWTGAAQYKSRIKNDERSSSTKQVINPATDPPAGLKAAVRVTVIIPARNEQYNIPSCLDSLMAQSYSKQLFEVIVVDDHSEDDTADIVKKYADKNVRLILLKEHVTDSINSYKKKAIEVAVAEAGGILIVTTDADCILPAHWLQTIAAFYEEKMPAFIAAPVHIDCGNRFIEIFQSLDFMTLQGITGAVVSKKQMTMCNGANMAYERTAFYEVGGFAGIDQVASGDDMLLMHKIYKHYPQRVLFLKSQNVIVHTAPVHTVKQFFNQRIRWASKAGQYDDQRILPVLLLVYLFNCMLMILPVVACFNNSGLRAVSGPLSTINLFFLLLLLKTGFELFFLFPVAEFFKKRSLLWVFPLMQPFHILYTVIAGWLGKFGSYQWKGREVS